MANKHIVLFSVLLSLLIVLFEFLFIHFELFDRFPHVGVFFHIFGGILICQISYFSFHDEILKLTLPVVFIYAIGSVSFACISWEIFEWVLGYYFKRVFLGSLDNTIFDLATGVFGGILGFFIARKLDKFVK